jgi:hypothetical protein
MRWVEIITLRSPGKINRQFLDELLNEPGKADTPKGLLDIRIYCNSVVESDFSIHLYWTSEAGSQNKSPLGLRFSYALRNMGLLNHSVWAEAGAREFVPISPETSAPRDIPVRPHRKHTLMGEGPNVSENGDEL